MRKIYTYQNSGDCPVICFLEHADVKLKSKFQSILTYIADEKNNLCEPYVKHISQNRFKELYEIRLKTSKTMARVVFSKQNENIVLLYAFYKHSSKDTQKALEHAFKLLNKMKNSDDFKEVVAA